MAPMCLALGWAPGTQKGRNICALLTSSIPSHLHSACDSSPPLTLACHSPNNACIQMVVPARTAGLLQQRRDL